MAQNERKLNNYKHETVLKSKGTKIEGSIDGVAIQSFDIISKKGVYTLKNKNDKKVFLNELKLNEQHKKLLSDHYKIVGDDALADKLVSRVFELEQLKLVNNVDNETFSTPTEINEPKLINTNESNSEVLTLNASEESKPKDTSYFPYILSIVALLAGVGIGFFISKLKRNPATLVSDKSEKNNTSKVSKNTEKVEREVKDNMAELDKNFNKLQREYDILYDEYQDRVNFDKLYFGEVNKHILTQFWDAVNTNNEKKVVENALKAVAHLTAIARLRLDIDQSFDQNNIDEIMGKSKSIQYKMIDNQTKKDTIPDSIITLISILKAYHIKGLDNVNFQGYIMNNLD